MFPIRDHNPSGRTPFVTILLIVINVGVFLAFFPAKTDAQLGWFYLDWGLVPARIMAGDGLETFVTSIFLHGGWAHLAGNMLFLWIFGDNLEEEMGHFGFVLFYLACGLASGLAEALAAPQSFVPLVGASGAIAGVMGGYLLLYPKARVDVLIILFVFFRIFAIPAWIVLSLWFAIQILSGLAISTEFGGVAYWAHAGGFAAGLVLTLPVWRRRGARTFWQATQGRPPHPQTQFKAARSAVPLVSRHRR